MRTKQLKGKRLFNSLDKMGNKKADNLHKIFKEFDVDFSTGVPCGVLRHIISNLKNDSTILHVSANKESEAIGLAAGAYFSGKQPLVYMQNSGLFASSNDIASLLIPYKIPVFLVVTYRGHKGEDAVQHVVTGKSTENLLKSFRLNFAVYENKNLKELVRRLFIKMKKNNLPAVLLLKRGWNL